MRSMSWNSSGTRCGCDCSMALNTDAADATREQPPCAACRMDSSEMTSHLCVCESHTTMQKLRIVILRFGTARDRNWCLNDGRIQNPSARL
jgi:hypothetical protein